ncbi:FecR domain-containing protein [Candidatus Latescibacterota bacterium]
MLHKRMFFKVIKLLLLFVLVSGVVYAQDDDQVAIIISMKGELEFRATSGDDWTAAENRSPLFNGNQLRTGTGVKAVVMYTGTGSRVLINENTSIEIQADIAQAGGKPEVERTRLILGEIYNKAKGNYEVETPSSVASVRGTEFNVLTQEGSDSYVGVEGIIEVMNAFGSIVLNQLQETTVVQNQAPTEPQPISRGEAERRTAWTDTVEPTWELNIIPEGGNSQDLEGVFSLTIQATKDGSIDSDATFALTEFISDSGAIEFSVDNGRTWIADPPAVTILGGQAMITARIIEEATVNISASAEDAASAKISISATQPKGLKTIELIFTNPDGSGEKTMTWDLEEK